MPQLLFPSVCARGKNLLHDPADAAGRRVDIPRFVFLVGMQLYERLLDLRALLRVGLADAGKMALQQQGSGLF